MQDRVHLSFFFFLGFLQKKSDQNIAKLKIAELKFTIILKEEILMNYFFTSAFIFSCN
jgi:hypothetical protein